MGSSVEIFTTFFLYILSFSIFRFAYTMDTIFPKQSIKDGQTLVSAGGSFELGFFSPSGSRNRYLGIWYKVSEKDIVWVANREAPVPDHSGVLQITGTRILILVNNNKHVIWSSNEFRTKKNLVFLQLLESGNLVVKDGKHENFLWQSFDYPCDTLLPGMKLGWNLETGRNRFISSWKSTDDPGRGRFSQQIDLRGFPQTFLFNGPKIKFRGGSWNGLYFTGIPGPKFNPYCTFEFEFDEKEVYYTYKLVNSSVISRYTLCSSGVAMRLIWQDQSDNWELFFLPQEDQCDNYALCGANACCNINDNPVCACLEGFKPKSPIQWNLQNWSDGCVRKTPLACGDEVAFLKYSGVKLPDTSSSWYDKSMTLKECQRSCLTNCSCVAYANLDIREGGSGCLLWFHQLVDIRNFSYGGQDLYIRLAASELVQFEKKWQTIPRKKKARIIAGSFVALFLLLLLGLLLGRRKKFKKLGLAKESPISKNKHEDFGEDLELPLFDLMTLANATGNFSINNKLGEGGFGPVYKGTLTGGQEIAVKRLSKFSGQGLEEFKTEVKLIAKLRHCNLVRLLGYCIEEEEKILIYEYMPNKSLDTYIFDHAKSKLLSWSQRIYIIGCIAQGVLYLHQDSKLKIIHRDLKASNILLDNEMNPKISDFGLARTFDRNQSQANTKRVIGTLGYMSPEYAVDGLFSSKSDVFSFGVLILETVSGKKNWGFYHPDHQLNLLGHAWILWSKGRTLEVIDKDVSFEPSEALRYIHVALLCVQKQPEDRPNMSSVVLMLGTECPLPQPKYPGFFIERNSHVAATLSGRRKSCSINEITITLLEGR